MMLLRSAADCTTSITSESMAAMHITGRLRTEDDHGCCDVCRTQACAFVGSGRRHHCFLLRARPHDRLLSAAACQDRRRLLHGRTGNDGVDCRSKLPFCQSGSARADGVGRVRVSVWNPGNTLVLDWRHPGNAVPVCCQDSDRKSTRLNSSHSQISYAVFCLKKKKKKFN